MLGKLYLNILKQHREQNKPASEAGDRFVMRCLAQNESSTVCNALLHAPMSEQLHDKLRENLIGDGGWAWMLCCRGDATAKDLETLESSLDENQTRLVASLAQSPKVLAGVLKRWKGGDRRWDQLVANAHADGKQVAEMLDCFEDLTEHYVNGAGAKNPRQVLEASKQPIRIALALAKGDRVLDEPAVNAICQTLKLDQPVSYQENPLLLDIVDALTANGDGRAAQAVMYHVAEAVKVCEIGPETAWRLDTLITHRGYRAISSGTSDIELANQVSQADGSHLRKLLHVIEDRIEGAEKNGGDIPIEAMRAAWAHPSNQTDSENIDFQAPVNRLFVQLDADRHQTHLETLIGEQKNPASAAALIDAVGHNGNLEARDWVYTAATVTNEQLAQEWSQWQNTNYNDGSFGGGTKTNSNDDEQDHQKLKHWRGETSLAGLFDVTGNATALSYLDIQTLSDLNRDHVLEALDELLGQNDAAWAAFETFVGEYNGTIGEIADMCQLVAAAGEHTPKVVKT